MEQAIVKTNRNIYQISTDMLALNDMLMDSGGELTPELEQALQITQAELETKAINYAWVIKANKAEIDTLDAEIKRLQAIKKSRENASNRLKEILKSVMVHFNIKKITSTTLNLVLSESTAVEITEEAAIPAEYKILKQEISKSQIGEALKEGVKVPGAQLVKNKNLQIK